MKKFMIDDSTSPNLVLDLKILSLEDLTANDSTNVFNQILPKLISQFKSLKEGLISGFSFISFSKEKRVLNNLEHLNYVNLSQSLVTTPEGFKGYFLDYLQTLEKIQTLAYKEAHEFIKEYQMVLSSFITNKDDQISSKDLSFFYNRVEQRTLENSGEIAKFFNSPNKVARAKLQSVLARLSDLETISKVTSNIESKHNIDDLKSIEFSINKIISMLNIVIEQMKRQDTSKVSRQAALNLSQGAYNLARYIEFISLLHFRISVILKVINDLFDFLNKKI
jgi:hypothetical protein